MEKRSGIQLLPFWVAGVPAALAKPIEYFVTFGVEADTLAVSGKQNRSCRWGPRLRMDPAAGPMTGSRWSSANTTPETEGEGLSYLHVIPKEPPNPAQFHHPGCGPDIPQEHLESWYLPTILTCCPELPLFSVLLFSSPALHFHSTLPSVDFDQIQRHLVPSQAFKSTN